MVIHMFLNYCLLCHYMDIPRNSHQLSAHYSLGTLASSLYLFNTYLLRTYYVPRTVVCPTDTSNYYLRLHFNLKN